jgi:hypothetical protein
MNFRNPVLTYASQDIFPFTYYTLSDHLDSEPILWLPEIEKAIDKVYGGYCKVSWVAQSSDIHAIIEPKNATITCKEIIADNSLELIKNVTPFFYEPADYGEEVDENGVDQWWVSFGYGVDDENFAKMLVGQTFIFDDYQFGLHYEITKGIVNKLGSYLDVSDPFPLGIAVWEGTFNKLDSSPVSLLNIGNGCVNSHSQSLHNYPKLYVINTMNSPDYYFNSQLIAISVKSPLSVQFFKDFYLWDGTGNIALHLYNMKSNKTRQSEVINILSLIIRELLATESIIAILHSNMENQQI